MWGVTCSSDNKRSERFASWALITCSGLTIELGELRAASPSLSWFKELWAEVVEPAARSEELISLCRINSVRATISSGLSDETCSHNSAMTCGVGGMAVGLA